LAICIAIAFPIVDGLVNRYFKIAFWDSFITKGVYYIFLLWGLYYSFRRFKRPMFFLPLFVLGLWLYSYIAYDENRPFLKDILFSLTTSSLPLFIITIGIRDFRRLYKSLKITSIIIIICSILLVDFLYSGELSIDYMNLSYYMQFAVMFMFVNAVIERKFIYWIFTIIGFLIVFIMGARGALIGLLLGVGFLFILRSKMNIKNIIIGFSISILLALYSFNYINILRSISGLLKDYNISSRTIDFFISKEIFFSPGRVSIFDKTIKVINNNILRGTGMAGDRATIGNYTHNLFTEFLIEYGVLLGGVIIIVLTFYLLKSLLTKKRNEIYYIFITVFFTTGFMKLQFSGSYSIEPMFFMMLALMYKISKGHRQIFKIRINHVQQDISKFKEPVSLFNPLPN
jgi:hypothetical protein